MSSKLFFCADIVPLDVLKRLGFDSDIIRIGDRITFPDSPETAMLSRIEYDKQMYHPGHVSLKFTSVISKASPAPLIRKKYLDNIRFIDLIAVGEDNDNFERITSDDIVYIAQNYYIQGFSIKYEKTDTYSFSLNCYSFDRKLTLSKYCKVYADVSLATGICNEIIREQLGDLYSKLAEVNGQAPDDLKASDLFLLGYYILTDDEKNKVTRVMSLQDKSHRSPQEEKELADTLAKYKSKGLLSYDGKLRVSAEADYGYRTLTENNNEVTHPYLVQYNESAYDFIARTAHMCGEFFYFEHGRICMGLPKSSRELVFDSMAHPPRKYDGFFSYSVVADDEEARAVASSVEFYHGDYMRGDAVSSEKKRFLSDNVSDESFYPEYKNMRERINYCRGASLTNALGTFFTNPNSMIPAFFESVAVGVADFILRKKFIPDDTDNWLDIHHGKKETRKTNSNRNTPPGKESKVSDEYTFNMCNEAYDLIGILEDASEQGRVELSFESVLPNLYLGDSISLTNVEGSPSAIVVGMHGEFHADYQDGHLSQTKSHSVEVIKYVEYKSKSNETFRLPIPAAQQRVDPQPGEQPVVQPPEKAHPMTGVVTNNNDPCFMGRVKVRLDSDPNNTTPWLRVIVPFAGSCGEKGGFCMVPSVGEHVIVDFVEGNINKPFVMGSLYYRNENPKLDHAPSIGDYPDDSRFYRDDYKTRSIVSGNGHAIVFKDLEDTSWMKMIFPPLNAFWPARKDRVAKFKETGKMQNPDFCKIKGGGITIRDGSGMCRVDIDPEHRALKLNSRFGNVEMNAFTGITINAPNGDVTIRGKNIVMEAGNNITLQAGTNIDNNLHYGKIGTEIFDQTVGPLLGMAAAKIATGMLKGRTGVDLEGLFDLSYLRSILEIIFKPVEGSLQLKSNRNTIITSGNGKVTLDKSLRSSSITFAPGNGKVITAFNELSTKDIDTQDAYIILKDVISVLLHDIDEYYEKLIFHLTDIINDAKTISEKLKLLKNELTEDFRNRFQNFEMESVLKFIIDGGCKFEDNSLTGFPPIEDVLKHIEVKGDKVLGQDYVKCFYDSRDLKYNTLFNLFQLLSGSLFIVRNEYSDISKVDEHLRRSNYPSRFSSLIHYDRISFDLDTNKLIKRLNIKKKDLSDKLLLSIPLPILDSNLLEGKKNDLFDDIIKFIHIPPHSKMTPPISWICEKEIIELLCSKTKLNEFIQKQNNVYKKSIIIQCLLDARIGDEHVIKFRQDWQRDPLDYSTFGKEYIFGSKRDSNWSEFVLRIQDANSSDYGVGKRLLFSLFSSFMDNSVKGVYSYANGKHAFLPSSRKLINYKGESGPRAFMGDAGQAGAIFMSTSAGQYTQFDENNAQGVVHYNPDIDALKYYLLNLF